MKKRKKKIYSCILGVHPKSLLDSRLWGASKNSSDKKLRRNSCTSKSARWTRALFHTTANRSRVKSIRSCRLLVEPPPLRVKNKKKEKRRRSSNEIVMDYCSLLFHRKTIRGIHYYNCDKWTPGTRYWWD